MSPLCPSLSEHAVLMLVRGLLQACRWGTREMARVYQKACHGISQCQKSPCMHVSVLSQSSAPAPTEVH
jgi:hypothetical protein